MRSQSAKKARLCTRCFVSILELPRIDGNLCDNASQGAKLLRSRPNYFDAILARVFVATDTLMSALGQQRPKHLRHAGGVCPLRAGSSLSPLWAKSGLRHRSKRSFAKSLPMRLSPIATMGGP